MSFAGLELAFQALDRGIVALVVSLQGLELPDDVLHHVLQVRKGDERPELFKVLRAAQRSIQKQTCLSTTFIYNTYFIFLISNHLVYIIYVIH